MYPQITGCDVLQFAPGVEVTPEVTRADEPSGLTVDIRVPQAPQLPPDLVTPEFKNVAVTLPSGVSVSPSAGDGLQACTAEEIDLESQVGGVVSRWVGARHGAGHHAAAGRTVGGAGVPRRRRVVTRARTRMRRTATCSASTWNWRVRV